MRELNFTYLVLVVAAYMVGLGNLWKFPDLILRYGLGGFVVYLLSVIVIVGMIGAALETTKKKGYDILEYFAKEYGKPAFALLFLLSDLLLIGYYSIVGGWTLSSMLLKGVPEGITWNMSMGRAFIAILLLILLTGKRRTTDFMVVSFVIFLIISSIVMWKCTKL
jgi:NSS family neurotransmitter:Na+ symporter